MTVLPWEPIHTSLTPDQFETEVLRVLRVAGQHLSGFSITHRERLKGPDGSYVIDILLRFEQLGAKFIVLVECKDYARAVERDEVQILHAKLQSLGAHKGILVANNGFQRGALEYASAHGIALLRVLEGALTYETRSLGPRQVPPPWADIPPYVGILVQGDPRSFSMNVVDERSADSLAKFLQGAS